MGVLLWVKRRSGLPLKVSFAAIYLPFIQHIAAAAWPMSFAWENNRIAGKTPPINAGSLIVHIAP
jgi:hypothetical protein